jgi:hypothetical protein
MKSIKYLVFMIGLIFLLVSLYQNFIYYKIPFNPINEFVNESLVHFHITENLPNGEGVNTKCDDPDTCGLILDYFSNLKLIPLKDKAAREVLSKQGNETYLTGMLEFNQSMKILISDIYLDNRTVIRISSPLAGFKGEGYYKIVDSKFDYNYIINLIGDNSE